MRIRRNKDVAEAGPVPVSFVFHFGSPPVAVAFHPNLARWMEESFRTIRVVCNPHAADMT